MIGLAAIQTRVSRLTAALLLVAAAGVGVAAGVVYYSLRAMPESPPLPEFHGQAAWAPGDRRAPGFVLHDEQGAPVSLASLRGRPVLLTFLGLHCPARCPAEAAQLRWILHGLPAAERPTLLMVSVDTSTDTPSAVRRGVRSWGLDGDWTWHWLHGTKAQLARVWHSYGLTTTRAPEIARLPALTLIDRSGFERTAYLFPFQPPSVQGDLAELARS